MNDEGGLHWGLDSFPSGVDLNHVSYEPGHIVLDFYFFFMALHLLGRFRLPLPLFEHISKSSHHCHRSEHQCTWRFSWLGCPFV